MREKDAREMMNSTYLRETHSVLLETYSREETDRIFEDAEKELLRIEQKYPNVPKAQRRHVSRIFPTVALYRALLQVDADQAMAIVEEGFRRRCETINKSYQKMLKPPFMRSFFLRMWNFGTKMMFGEDAGFEPVILKHTGKEYRMDMMACPYVAWTAELGCPELCHVFCDNDVYSYSNLPGISFIRKGTLAGGRDRCDFYLKRNT